LKPGEGSPGVGGASASVFQPSFIYNHHQQQSSTTINNNNQQSTAISTTQLQSTINCNIDDQRWLVQGGIRWRIKASVSTACLHQGLNSNEAADESTAYLIKHGHQRTLVVQ
jgi:hypothetical protein